MKQCKLNYTGRKMQNLHKDKTRIENCEVREAVVIIVQTHWCTVFSCTELFLPIGQFTCYKGLRRRALDSNI